MVVDYLSSQPNRAGYQVSTKQESGPTVKETLMADDPPVPEHGFSDQENFLFLRGKGDSEQWVKFSREALDLCSPSSPSSLIMESTTVALSFSLDNPGSAWILTGLNK